ncbi:MAG: hypothetical protein ACKV0T_29375 [Planctomycetales bacterium]
MYRTPFLIHVLFHQFLGRRKARLGMRRRRESVAGRFPVAAEVENLEQRLLLSSGGADAGNSSGKDHAAAPRITKVDVTAVEGSATTVTVDFSEAVFGNPNGVVIRNAADQVVTPTSVSGFGTATLTFVLPVGISDGQFEIDVESTQNLVDDTGNSLDGDDDGVSGGEFTEALPVVIMPDLSGLWSSSGEFTKVEQSGKSLTFTNRAGDKSVGKFIDGGAVSADDWNATATIDTTTADKGRISWSNGITWLRLSYGGQFYNPANNGLTSVVHEGSQLKFVNVAGGTTSGTFTGPTEISVPAWGQTVKFVDGQLTFSGGSAWKKLDLSPEFHNRHGDKVGVIQHQTAEIEFVNRLGEKSSGKWISPTEVKTLDWNSIGTVSNGQIVWNNGTVWNKNLQVVGTGNGSGRILIAETDRQLLPCPTSDSVVGRGNANRLLHAGSFDTVDRNGSKGWGDRIQRLGNKTAKKTQEQRGRSPSRNEVRSAELGGADDRRVRAPLSK